MKDERSALDRRSPSQGPQHGAEHGTRSPRLALALALVVLVVGAFASVLGAGFCSLDDHQNLVHNPHFRGFGAEELAWMASTPHMGNYQPLSWIVYALDFALWGLSGPAFHLSSVLLHAAAALAVFALAREVLELSLPTFVAPRGRELGAALAAALFAVHPLRAESVAWVTGRNDVVAGLFLALALRAWLRHARAVPAPEPSARGAAVVAGLSVLALVPFFASVDFSSRAALALRGPGILGLALASGALIVAARCWLAATRPPGGALYASALAWSVCSLLGKGYAVVLPGVLLVLDFWPLRRVALTRRDLRARGAALVVEKAPFLALALAFAALTAWAKAAPAGLLRTLEEHGPLERVLQAAYGLAFYPWKTVWPTDLVPMVDLPSDLAFSDARFLVPLLGVSALTAVLVARRRAAPAPLAAWVAYALLIGPSLGLAQSGAQLVADRYSYVATWPLALLAGGGAALLGSRGERARRLVLGASALAVGLLTAATWRQARLWRDSETLFQHAIAINGSPRMIANLAMVANQRSYEDPGRRAEHLARALALSEQAIAVATERGVLVPTYGLHHGTILYNLGRFEEAARELAAYVAARPDSPEGVLNLGLALNRLGRYAEAERALAEAARLVPDSATAWRNLGLAREAQEKRAAATEAYRRALAVDPTDAVSRGRLAELATHARG